jgi:autophagy-related protein 16
LLQDELTAHQLEMDNMDERLKAVMDENAQLVERWLRKMNEEAQKMNAANSFYERFYQVPF